jgi:hypothetical protein
VTLDFLRCRIGLLEIGSKNLIYGSGRSMKPIYAYVQISVSAMLILVSLSACGTISLPVKISTSKGEVFSGKAEGPPFSGKVNVDNGKGVTCIGDYTVSSARLINAPSVVCSDGRTANLTATLEADLVSARGTAIMSDGTRAEVGVGRLAGTTGPLERDKVFTPPVNYRGIVAKLVRETFFDPYSIRDAEISEPVVVPSVGPVAWKVCIRANAKNRMGAYTGRKNTGIIISDGNIVSVESTDALSGQGPACPPAASFGRFSELEQIGR